MTGIQRQWARSKPGVVVAGYRIGALLGRGGMGVVYRARDHDLERDVALKVIAPELVEDAHIRTRFLREARAAAAIEHPHVIPVHAAGEQDGVAFLAMRLVNGDDLRTLVRREGALPAARACGLIEQAAGALDAIHEAGFVHRDVKPGNLLVDRSDHLYLTDFGLVKHVLTSDGASRTGGWVGTVDFMAPEQIRGGHVDARADVYSLGGVLHYLLTGHVPFERDGEEAKLWAQLAAEPPRPSTLHPGLPRTFDAVVARALAKDPDERYPSAGDLARAARAAETGTAPTLPERTVARGAAAPGASPSEPGLVEEVRTVTSKPKRRARRRRALVAVAGLLLVGAGIGAAALAWPEREVERTPRPSGCGHGGASDRGRDGARRRGSPDGAGVRLRNRLGLEHPRPAADADRCRHRTQACADPTGRERPVDARRLSQRRLGRGAPVARGRPRQRPHRPRRPPDRARLDPAEARRRPQRRLDRHRQRRRRPTSCATTRADACGTRSGFTGASARWR